MKYSIKLIALLLVCLFFSEFAHAQILNPNRPPGIEKKDWKQIPKQIRKEVKEDFKESKKEAKKDKDSYYHIPPGESVYIPYTPETSVLFGTPMAPSEGNWGRSYMEVPTYEQRIVDKALKEGRKYAIVLVADTGFPDHHVLKPYIIDELSFSYTGEPRIDGHMHSTHVIGEIIGYTDALNLGVCQEAAKAGLVKIVASKVCTNSGSCNDNHISKAIIDFVNNTQHHSDQGHPRFINLSLGGSYSQKIADALAYARSKGVLAFASNGNSGRTPAAHPGSDKNTLGSAALDKHGNRASFSQYGPTTMLSGPGVSILSTVPGDKLGYSSGTSMSCPHDVGAAVSIYIMHGINPTNDIDGFIDYMTFHATDEGQAGWDQYLGYGTPKLGAYWNNPPTGEEEPDDPGDPGPDDPIVREQRRIKVALPGPYTTRYQYVNSTADAKPSIIDPVNKLMMAYNGGLVPISALYSIDNVESVEVSNIVIEVITKYDEAYTRKITKQAFEDYLTRWVLVVANGSDDWDVTYHKAFFGDMILQRYNAVEPQEITVFNIEYPGAKFYVHDLKHWGEQPSVDNELSRIMKEYPGPLYQVTALWALPNQVQIPGGPTSEPFPDFGGKQVTYMHSKEELTFELIKDSKQAQPWKDAILLNVENVKRLK